MTAGYESREYERLLARNFGPYSEGHRNMYELALADMKARGYGLPFARVGEESGNTLGARVLEAGFGIGWGLDRMVAEKVLRSYVGYEPNADSHRYVLDRYAASTGVLHGDGREALDVAPSPINMLLIRNTFRPILDPAFDCAFCIEVIEHVPMEEHLAFLGGLRVMAPVLYFSTPDKLRKPSEGVRTDPEWADLLSRAGYDRVRINTDNWTTFYLCERNDQA